MSAEGENLNKDPGLELSPVEKRATNEATNIRNFVILITTFYLLSIIPIIEMPINRVMADLKTLYWIPVILIYWLIRYKLVNRVSRMPRDLWLSIAIWIGTIAVKGQLLL
jgi:hypothetical protein